MARTINSSSQYSCCRTEVWSECLQNANPETSIYNLRTTECESVVRSILIEILLSSSCHFNTYKSLSYKLSDTIAYSLTDPRIYIHFCSAGGRRYKRQVCNYAAWSCLLADSWLTGRRTVPVLCGAVLFLMQWGSERWRKM